MKIRVKYTEKDYFHKLLLIIYNIPPFTRLRPRELELYANLLSVNHKYRNIPFKERNKVIFSNEEKIIIATKMGIKLTNLYNMICKLRNIGIIGNEALLAKYTLPLTPSVTFLFEEEI
jgi:hypothetical protein